MKGNDKIGNYLGRLGEDIACLFLENKGFSVINRNYRKKWGEIDIIAIKNSEEVHFIEVKSVSCEIKQNVTHEKLDHYRAEDNLHNNKLKRLSRTIQSYLAEKNVSSETKWFFDVITVAIDKKSKNSRVKFIKDIVI
jgi:putative endonuclease